MTIQTCPARRCCCYAMAFATFAASSAVAADVSAAAGTGSIDHTSSFGFFAYSKPFILLGGF